MDYRIYSETEKAADKNHRENEDSFMYSQFSFMKDKKIQLIVVADGMGGLSEGRRASESAVKGFMNTFYVNVMEQYMSSDMDEFSLKYSIGDIEKIMVKAIQAANRKVCDGADEFEATGSTISAVCLIDDCAVIANVGDSPIYLYRKNAKKMKLMSKLQTVAEQAVAAGTYERYSPEYYRNDHILYCSLGQYDKILEDDIYVSSIGNLKSGDAILTGSDGCFGHMNEKILGRIMNECSTQEEGFLLNQIFSLARMDKDDDQTAFLCIAE